MTRDHRSDEVSLPKPKKRSRKLVASTLALTIVGTAGAVGASQAFRVKADRSGAQLTCPGGIESLGQVLKETSPTFPGDPHTVIHRLAYDLDGTEYEMEDLPDGGLGDAFSYRIEKLTIATHTGTHLDAPAHFIETGARSVDQLEASEFVWPSYIIDVRDRLGDDGLYAEDTLFVTIDDIKAYEKTNGKIQRGSLVIVETGLGSEFNGPNNVPPTYDTVTGELLEVGKGYFADAPGFSGDAVQWMIDNRDIEAIGSDTLGPDSSADGDFSATYTILADDGVAIPGLANLGSMSVKGDIVMAAPVRLLDGSAFQVNPLACLGSSSGHGSNGNGHGKDNERD